jgi:hypothetical protein
MKFWADNSSSTKKYLYKDNSTENYARLFWKIY